MKKDELFQIGAVQDICNITKKTLRFYDKMGILSPDKVSEDNGYRYYSKKTLLTVPIIKYFKQSGFKLEEMKAFLEGGEYEYLEKAFRGKIDDLQEEEREVNLKIKSLKDWYNLIIEAEQVIENNVCDVSVKFLENSKVLYYDQDFNYDYMDSIINIEFTNYVESVNNAITGPVIIMFPSFEDKMKNKCTKARILQRTILRCQDDQLTDFGGSMVVSCYHIGSHESINETYMKIREWTDNHGYICAKESYERYVIDYWTTKKSNKFVTEVIIKIIGSKK